MSRSNVPSKFPQGVTIAGPVPQSSSSSIPTVTRIQGSVVNPPPLPPRPQQVMPTRAGNVGGYVLPNSHLHSGYGGYNSYGYGGGYGGYGYGAYSSNYGYAQRGGAYTGRSIDELEGSRFIQFAEESSRPGFQSIESIVRTFGNVTMMLESTFHALQTSFHAVLGVAENFERLRDLSVKFAKYLSAFAVLRTIYYFYRRLLYMLGLIKNHPSTEAVWNAAERKVNNNLPASPENSLSLRSSWPLITYFGLLFGGPFVIYKIMSSIKGSKKVEEDWNPLVHESDEALVMYAFRATNDMELSVSPGERLKVQPIKYANINSGWIKAVNGFNRFGMVPCNYLKVKNVSKSSKTALQGVENGSALPPLPSASVTNPSVHNDNQGNAVNNEPAVSKVDSSESSNSFVSGNNIDIPTSSTTNIKVPDSN